MSRNTLCRRGRLPAPCWSWFVLCFWLLGAAHLPLAYGDCPGQSDERPVSRDDSEAASARSTSGWGHLKGRIVVEGSVAPPGQLNPDKDRAFCLADGHEIFDETVVVDADGGLRDVYVMMYLSRGAEPPPVHPSYEEVKQQPVVLDNKKCRFEPHAAFVRTGQTLRFSNSDPVGHNVHTLNNDEKNKTVPPGGFIDVTYEQADRVPADVECNIHPFMKGLLLVRDDPYAAISAADGTFEITNIPAGEWQFQFWHKKVGYLSMLTRNGETFLQRRGEFAVTIQDGETLDLGDLTLAAEVLNRDD